MHASISSIIARLDSDVYLDRSDAMYDIEMGARHIKPADRAVIVGRLVGLRERTIEGALSRGGPSRAAASTLRGMSVGPDPACVSQGSHNARISRYCDGVKRASPTVTSPESTAGAL